MPSVYPYTPCPACGRRHNFGLVGAPAGDRDYEYVCPETGRRAVLRPAAPPEAVTYLPQGAVPLAAPRPPQAVG